MVNLAVSESIKDLHLELTNPCLVRNGNGQETSLNVTGRETHLKIIAGNMLARLQPLMVARHCSSSMNLLLNILQGFDIQHVYQSSAALSAHFQVMAQDWENGRHCEIEEVAVSRDLER